MAAVYAPQASDITAFKPARCVHADRGPNAGDANTAGLSSVWSHDDII